MSSHLLLIRRFALPDFIQSNPLTKRIINKWISVDPSIVESLPNIIQVERSVVESITKFHIVDNSQVRLMTQIEKTALEAEEAQAIIDAENLRIANLDTKISSVDLSDLTLTKIDTKIDAISNLAQAKTFFKLLVKYLVKYAKNN